MPGDTLPPVIIPVDGDDSGFLDMLDRDVAALRAAAGEIDGLLAGLDLGAALADSLSGVNLGSLNADEIAQGLSEAMGGVGSALGQDVGAEFGDAVRSEGVQAGAALAEGIAEGASGVGDSIGEDLGDGLSSQASAAGSRAGEALSESLTGSVSGVGQDVASQVDAGLGSLPSHFAVIGASAGHAMTASLETALLGLAGAAAGVAGVLGGVGSVVEARLVDVLMQAGQSAGPSLISGISAGAVGSAASVSDSVGRALESSLDTSLIQAGGSGGDALLAGIQGGVAGGAGDAAVRIGESLQAPLEAQMTHVGQVAGDAFNAGLGATVGPGAGGEGGGGANVIDFEKSEQELGQQAEQLGRNTRLSFAQGWQTRNGVIPFGGQMEPDELMGMGQQQQDSFVPNLAGAQGSWILASKTGAKQAADEAWQAYGDELSGLVIPPDRFLAMTDAGIAQWQENVAVQAQASGAGFVSAFADALTMGMAGIDWSALTEAQAAALGNAMRGVVAEVAPEVEAEMGSVGTDAVTALQAAVASTGSGVADELIAQIVEARQAVTAQLVELAIQAAEEGEQAGSMFARAFSAARSAVMGGLSSAKGAVVDSVSAEFAEDPQWAAATAAASELGDTVVGRVKEAFGALSAVAAEDGGTAGGLFARGFVSAVSAIGDSVRLVFAQAPEAMTEAGGEAGSEFGDALIASLEARLSEIGAAGGPGFAELVAQQLETQLALAAAEATAEYEQQLADDLAAAEAEAVAQAGQMRADINLDRMFSNLTQTLPSEFVDAFSQIRNGIALTEEEFAQFSEYGQQQLRALVTLLQTEGVQAADTFAESLSTKSYNERLDPSALMAGGSEAESLAGDLGGVEEAAAGATSAFGGMSSMMMGPVGMGVMMLATALPMLSQLFDTSAASASTFSQAVQQDSGAVGDNTAAIIQQQLAQSGLNDMAQSLGVSQATLIEYAAGESQAQQQVTAAYNQQQDALNAASNAEGVHSKAQNDAGNAADKEAGALANKKAALDAVTGAVQQAIAQDQEQNEALLAAEQTTQIYDASVKALGTQMQLQVQQTQMSNAATAEFGSQILFAESSMTYMTAAMNASVASSRESALTNAYASVGLLNLGSSQTALNAQLAASETAYTEAQQGASAYNAVLSSLNGTTNTLLSAEASFTTTLNGLTNSIKTNGDSLDVNSVKGAANVQVVTQIAQAAQAAAVAVYQSDEANGKASQAYQDASTKLLAEKDAFEAAAEKAGFNKTQVQALADELFQLPPSVSTTVNVNTSQAQNNLDALYGQIDTLIGAGSTLSNSLDITAAKESAKLGGGRASGGPVEEGVLYHVNESGREGFFVPPANGYVVPHDAMAALGSGGSSLGPAWSGPSGGSSEPPGVTVHVYLDSREITSTSRAEAQQYKTRNSLTGFN